MRRYNGFMALRTRTSQRHFFARWPLSIDYKWNFMVKKRHELRQIL